MEMGVIELAQALVRLPSITPEGSQVLDWIEQYLNPLHPRCYRLPFSEPGTPTVDNLFLLLGEKGPHLCFVGHVDVVPVGISEDWVFPPFEGIISDGFLFGRGASDMKGGIAAFLAAISRLPLPLPGRISLLLTCDEEGPAINGVRKVMPWLKENKLLPDACIVGEPTSSHFAGDTLKIGRRGSVTFEITLHGKAGHVAYPRLATNPLPALGRLINALTATSLDAGTEMFDPSHLEICWVDCPNRATNVIPSQASFVLNIRFNPLFTSDTLEAWVKEKIEQDLPAEVTYKLTRKSSSEPFLCQSQNLINLVQQAIQTVTKKPAHVSTSGGTSDARFIHPFCPVLECGGVNTTIHQVNESANVNDLLQLEEIYHSLIVEFFKNPHPLTMR